MTGGVVVEFGGSFLTPSISNIKQVTSNISGITTPGFDNFVCHMVVPLRNYSNSMYAVNGLGRLFSVLGKKILLKQNPT